MSQVVTFGLGGYCENCDETHDHPLNNIIDIQEVESNDIVENDLKASAIQKLEALGLSVEELLAILN